jgi:uncharacterized membrane protein YqaE (UPF0057 family)
MNRFFWSMLAIFFPWVVLLMKDNPGGALMALIMQATAIGWIPASAWAWRVVHEDWEDQEEERKRKRRAKKKKASKSDS